MSLIIKVVPQPGYLRPWWLIFLPRLKGVRIMRERIKVVRQTEKYVNLMHQRTMKRFRDLVIFGGDPNTRVENPDDSV